MLSKKPVEQYDAETGEMIKRHESVYAAVGAIYHPNWASQTTNMTGIINCCKGRQKTAYGYVWKYAKT